MDSIKYELVATGGTFDRLHKGHEALLDKAFAVGERVIIGVTSDEMVSKDTSKILREKVLSFEERLKELKDFLNSRKYNGREIIIELNNAFGPTVLEENVQAVVCTRETKTGAGHINQARRKIGLPLVEIIECPFIVSKDHFHISSTRIRLGEIDRQGYIYIKHNFGNVLPGDLRTSLTKPIDRLFPDLKSALATNGKKTLFCSVGDQVDAGLMDLKAVPDIAIVDLNINRQATVTKNQHFDYQVINPAGQVTNNLIKTCRKAVRLFLRKKIPTRIRVIGEEDLAVLPLILVCPLGSVILYGQPPVGGSQKGVVRVVVTEKKKRWVVELLKKFD